MFFKESRVRSNVLIAAAYETEEDRLATGPHHCSRLRTMCPTQWTVRAEALRRMVYMYKTVIVALSDVAENGRGDAGTKARGLHDQLGKGKTFLGMLICLDVLTPIDELSVSLQRSCETVSGTRAAVDVVCEKLLLKRSDEHFHQLWIKTEEKCQECELVPP